MTLPPTVPPPALDPASSALAAQAPGHLAAVSEPHEMALVWKLRLGMSEMVRGPGAATLPWPSSVSVSGPSPLRTVITQQAGGSPDEGAVGEEFGAGVHFQGMKARGLESCSPCREDRGAGRRLTVDFFQVFLRSPESKEF